jgi:hypothetical protein
LTNLYLAFEKLVFAIYEAFMEAMAYLLNLFRSIQGNE